MRHLLALLALLVASGCSAPTMSSVPGAKLRASGGYDLIEGLDVPRVRGVEGCGAQALAAVMAFAGAPMPASDLAEDLPWHDDGATPVDLLLAARDRGFAARIARGDWDALGDEVRAGVPAVVMIDAAPAVHTIVGPLGGKVMHWAVVCGMARDGSRILLGAPGDRYHVVRRAEFERRWDRSDRCTIVVTRVVSSEPP